MDRHHEAITSKSFFATWRERRRADEPPHAEWNALRQSVDALNEAFFEKRPFSWACSHQQKKAALETLIARSIGALA